MLFRKQRRKIIRGEFLEGKQWGTGFLFFFERFVNYMVREMREKANKRCTEFLATVEGSVETWALWICSKPVSKVGQVPPAYPNSSKKV